MGWGWVEIKVFLCGCDNAAAGSLCSRPQELSGASGTLECHATYGNATVRTSPPSPSPAPCPSPGSVDRRTCDFSWAGYVGTSVHDTSSCVGYDSPSTTKPGNLSGCQETVLYGEWRPFTGTSAGCRGFIRSDAFPDGRSADNRERCRLTPAQWSKLQDRRAACGMLPRAARADEKANAEQQSWTDTLGTIYTTLSILSVPAESAANGLPELTGLSSRSRARRAGDMCPSASPVNFDEWKGLGRTYLSKKPEAGLLMNTNSTKGHAEGDALLQLAAQRMRMPPAFNGAPASDWFAVGGREGGCGELLVDRKPCSSSCAPEGIANARRTAGLQTLIVHSPGGCRLFEEGGPTEGTGYPDSAACP